MKEFTINAGCWISDQSLSWIEELLSDRFGVKFTLFISKTKNLQIRIDGQQGCIETTIDNKNFLRSDSSMDCCYWNAAEEGWETAIEKFMPILGLNRVERPLINEIGGNFFLRFDLLGMLFWILSRNEEVNRSELDSHFRFKAKSSHAYLNNYLHRPIVDEWLYIFKQIVSRQWPSLTLKNSEYATYLSHDVDSPARYCFSSLSDTMKIMLRDILKRRFLSKSIMAPYIRIRGRRVIHDSDPHNNFKWIMDLSERHDLKSAFYFICGKSDRYRDADYSLKYDSIRLLLKLIHSRGHEIGLHPSYNSFKSEEIIMQEFENLKSTCRELGITQDFWGGRMHYLRWAQPFTLRYWANAGLAYDSTLGYADMPGFRCGTCFEYYAYDPVKNEKLPIRIRPLVAMECSVLAPRYLGLGTSEQAFNKFLEVKNSCRAVKGNFTLLWHNTQLLTKQERELYNEVLAA